MLSRFNSLSFFLIFPVIRRLNCSQTIIPIRNSSKVVKILGIETSCDDTAAAVVDSDSNILGEAHYNQQETHIEFGGIIPYVAKDLHKKHIKSVVEQALANANCTVSDLDAIAATMKPGLELSLWVGMTYAKHLALTYNKPFIPIHHMEAHALTPRLKHKNIEFPFLVLLISGGHCLLSLANSVEEFNTFGKNLDDAPGEVYDKIARALKLKNLPKYKNMSGGQSIELASENGNPFAFELKGPLLRNNRSCDFSFSGLKTAILNEIKKSELLYKVKGNNIIPNYASICSSFQYILTKHICQRVHRAMIYIEQENLISKNINKKLIISGGVASNKYIISHLNYLCAQNNYECISPEPMLCTDNGIMIAWNAIELYNNKSKRILYNRNEIIDIDIQAKCKLGNDWSEKIIQKNIPNEKLNFM